MLLTERELATLILVGIFALYCVSRPTVRLDLARSFTGLIRELLAPKILLVLAAFLAWVLTWVWLASLIGAWDWNLLKDTAIVVATVGIPLLFRAHESRSGLDVVGHEVLATGALMR